MREAEKFPAVMSSARSPVTTAFVTLRLVAVIAPEMLAPVHVSLPFASTLNLFLMESPLVPKYMLALPPNSLAVRKMLLSEIVHGPNVESAAAVIFPDSTAPAASSVP